MDLSRVSKKTPYEDLRLTLTAIDIRTVDNFDNYYATALDKKKELTKLMKRRSALVNKHGSEHHQLNKQIKELSAEIQSIESENKKHEYLLNASSHLLEYAHMGRSASTKAAPEIVNGFIVIKGDFNKEQICKNYEKECLGSGFSLCSSASETAQHGDLTCEKCGIEKLTNPRESFASCPNCGEVSRYQDSQNNRGEYSEEVEVISPFAYKKINHFKDWISSLLAKEGFGVPQQVIDSLLKELKKNRIESREEVTEALIKKYLKKLGWSGLYVHAPAIMLKLCNIPPPNISPKLEAKLNEMFQQIQAPFSELKPSMRKNFMSYSFCIHKLLQLLRQEHLLSKLTLLKSRDKLYNQDMVWKGITKKLGWKYFPSL